MFKYKQKVTGETADGGTKDAEIMVSLKYLSNFWRILEMPLINYEMNLILTWSDKCLLPNDKKATTFAIAHTKLHVTVATCMLQLKIMQNCLNNKNQVLKEQLTETNFNQKYQYKHQTHI